MIILATISLFINVLILAAMVFTNKNSAILKIIGTLLLLPSIILALLIAIGG